MNINAQEYLEKNWTDKSTKIISSPAEKLTGDLIIQDYPNLEEISLPNQELTSLTVINCPNLKEINVRHNQLTKLELDSPNLEEIIAGQNELTSLDLTPCQKLKKLIIPDNPSLTEIKGLNLATINNINIANTQISLSEEFEELKAKNKRLYQALRKWDDAGVEKELKIIEPIQTPKQTKEAIQRLLNKTEQRWRDHFEGKKIDELLETRLNTPKKREKAKTILRWIVETQTSRDYEGLADKWSEGKEWLTSRGEEYNTTHDYDCTLDSLVKHLLNLKNFQQKQLEHYERQQQ